MIPTHAQKSLKFVHSSLPMHNKSNYLGIAHFLYIENLNFVYMSRFSCIENLFFYTLVVIEMNNN
jgi:hypothetical protein